MNLGLGKVYLYRIKKLKSLNVNICQKKLYQ